MHLDLATFADGHRYCLVAVVAVEVDKFLPVFVPILKKDAVSGLAAVKEALTLYLHQITGSSITRIQADGGGEFDNQKLKHLCFDKNIILSFSQAHQPSSNPQTKASSRLEGSPPNDFSTLDLLARRDKVWNITKDLPRNSGVAPPRRLIFEPQQSVGWWDIPPMWTVPDQAFTGLTENINHWKKDQ